MYLVRIEDLEKEIQTKNPTLRTKTHLNKNTLGPNPKLSRMPAKKLLTTAQGPPIPDIISDLISDIVGERLRGTYHVRLSS